MSDFYEEACYLSNGEADDSEAEEFAPMGHLSPTPRKQPIPAKESGELAWDDPAALLSTWLGELDSLQMGLESAATETAVPRPAAATTATAADPEKMPNEQRIDSYRFSLANLEDSQDGDLDAILKELCALGSRFDQELKTDASSSSRPSEETRPTHEAKRNNPAGRAANKLKIELAVEPPSRTEPGLRTESPDNDSAFSDNISMLSSESSASSGASGARTDASCKSSTSNASSTGSADEAARLKAEKIRLALDKIREANVKKLFIKAFMNDGSTKSLLVDEKMTVAHVMRMLSDKNHIRMEPKWVLVEHLPDLYMERFYEDHEMLVDQLMLWTRDSRNTLLFVERPEKYNLFSRPEDYLLTGSFSDKDRTLDDDARQTLVDEFFSGLGGGIPEIEGPLYLKAEGKKAWKKFYFVLRASGIYYSPKGKATSRSSKDLVCLATFDVNQIYSGVMWRKKYKAPTDFGFAIKHPKLQSRSSKFIKYLCAEDEKTMAKWMTGIRIAKYGRTLLDNYRGLVEELAQEDLDQLANARSFSIASMQVNGNQVEKRVEETVSELPNTLRPLSRQDSIKSRASTSSSSGCMSERSSAATLPEIAFESDSPVGTIKRKPSMTPKIPLTSTTRLLVKDVDENKEAEMRNSFRQSFRKSLTDEVNTIRRKTSTNSVISTNSTVSVNSASSTNPVVDFTPSQLPIPESVDTPDVDSLPLPPPPTFSSPDDGIASDHDVLPPPPPEAFDLPDAPFEETPPPPPPPEPASPPEQPLKPCLKNAPRVPPKPSIVNFQRRDSDQNGIYANSAGLASTLMSQSPSKKNRRITFDDRVARSPSPPPQKPTPTPVKPALKSTPQKLTAPPSAFLSDLQRVMQKKWQVAQKCKDEEVTPHSVLGFRDAPPPAPVPAAYKENSVRAWVAEHYGSEANDASLGFYENVFVPSSSNGESEYRNCVELRRDYTHPYLPHARVSSASSTGTAVSSSSGAKRPPPPPPKRSETTHLSTRIH